MAQSNLPIVWVSGYRKANADLVDVRDPRGILDGMYGNHQLDRYRSSGALMLYNDGHHLYTDLTYFRSLFDNYQHRAWHHPGLHFIPREDFRTARNIHESNEGLHTGTVSSLYLRHDGFTGLPGERTASVWFATGNQLTRSWEFKIKPGQILNLLTDYNDWCLESVWLRKDRKVRKDLLNLKRKL